MNDENPYAAPEDEEELESTAAEQFDDEKPIPYEFGGEIKRGIAKLIDLAMFGFIFTFCFGLLLEAKEKAIDAPPLPVEAYENVYTDEDVEVIFVEGSRQTVTGMQGFLALLALLVGGACCEWFTGTTPGKLLLGLRVVQADEIATPSIGSALGRNIAMLFDGMFLGVPALFIMRTNPYKQRMGDVAARTFVVKRSSIPEPLSVTAQDFVWGTISLLFIIGLFAFLIVVI